MSSKKIVVFTATGYQGSSVVEHLKVDPQYTLVGIMRDPTSAAAQKLGIQLHKGDLYDPASYDEALQGAYGAFLNSDFASNFLGKSQYNFKQAVDDERKQLADAVAACKKHGLKHVVFSTLTPTSTKTMEYQAAKHDTQALLATEGVPYTTIYPSGWYKNVIKYDQIKKQDDGTFLFSAGVPDSTSNDWIASEQIGLFVKAALDNPKKFLNTSQGAISEKIKYGDIAKRLSAISGKKIVSANMSLEYFNSDEYKAQLGPFHDVFDALTNHPLDYQRPGLPPKEVVPDLWTLEDWARQDKDLRALLEF